MSIITSFRAGLAFFTRIPVGSAPLPPTLSGVVAWLPAVGRRVGALGRPRHCHILSSRRPGAALTAFFFSL